MISIQSKLSQSKPSIFSIMSALSAKYNAINLAQGYPNYDCPDALKDLISYYLNNGKNQYAPMTGVKSLRQAIAQKYSQIYNISIDADTEVTVTAGATQGLFTAITAFLSQGDEAIIVEPAYDSYRPAIGFAGGTVVPYPLGKPDYKINWSEFSTLISDKTRLVIINTPHNPTGKIWQSSDMIALQEILTDRNIIVISDEVYEHLVYDKAKHHSIMRYPELYAQSLAMYSFGKTYHCTGWKMGYCIGPAHITKEFRNIHQWNVFSVNSFLQYALADYMADKETYESLPDFYGHKRDLFEKAMKGSRLKPLVSEGTYFQLYDYSHLSTESDLDFAKRLTRDYKVAAIPVSPFYTNGTDNRVVRFCYAKTDEVLLEAAERLCAV